MEVGFCRPRQQFPVLCVPKLIYLLLYHTLSIKGGGVVLREVARDTARGLYTTTTYLLPGEIKGGGVR